MTETICASYGTHVHTDIYVHMYSCTQTNTQTFWVDMMKHARNPSMWEVDTGGSAIQGYSWLRDKLEASLVYKTPSQIQKGQQGRGCGSVDCLSNMHEAWVPSPHKAGRVVWA